MSQLADGRITPHDYLEKIFQLPKWVDALDARTSRSMLDALLGPVARPDDGSIHTSDAPTGPRAEREVPSVEQPGDSSSPPRRAVEEAATASVPGSATVVPFALDVSNSERHALLDLAPLLARSPRVLKRFLNTYRLLKAELADLPQLALARFLLAVGTGRPAFGEALLAHLDEAANGSLAEHLGAFAEDDISWLRASAPDDVMLEAWEVDTALPVVRAVRRYLFRTGENVQNPGSAPRPLPAEPAGSSAP
ncbi:hypothetical protein [Actinomycetospora sp. CA-084318]|uniref:hypothetical protein n=1 Tax=Actinomycetospora sp. CA-084318 TaxID=3239892 RepID=UPI003D9948BE